MALDRGVVRRPEHVRGGDPDLREVAAPARLQAGVHVAAGLLHGGVRPGRALGTGHAPVRAAQVQQTVLPSKTAQKFGVGRRVHRLLLAPSTRRPGLFFGDQF